MISCLLKWSKEQKSTSQSTLAEMLCWQENGVLQRLAKPNVQGFLIFILLHRSDAIHSCGQFSQSIGLKTCTELVCHACNVCEQFWHQRRWWEWVLTLYTRVPSGRDKSRFLKLKALQEIFPWRSGRRISNKPMLIPESRHVIEISKASIKEGPWPHNPDLGWQAGSLKFEGDLSLGVSTRIGL